MALAFAGKAMAASAISTIVRKSFEYLEKYINTEGIKPVKERLERTLPQVQVVFDAVDMERIRDQSESLDAWLWQIRDAVEEAEDALDEVEYYNLEKRVKSGGGKVSTSLYNCKQMFIQQFSTTFKVGTFKRVLDAMKNLDEVAVGVERFILFVDRLDSCSLGLMSHQEIFGNPRETSSFLVDERIIGRDTERDQIVEWLIKLESNDQDLEDCNITTFAIVGIGGMGKASLAQTVYLDQRVKQCFDQSIWVCVSNDVNVHTLTRKIIQEITIGGIDVTSLNTLQEILKQKLSSKKFLLVVDDVWNDETSADWEKLLAPLSKILLTTRMQSVVDAVKRALGGGTESLKLEGLQENDLLKLLNKHAFVGVTPDDYINLQEIGKKIAKKLNGSPLAAKVMGGLLNNSMDTISWNRILRESTSNIEHGSVAVMEVLRLSYHHLPPHLQACFRYCSLFHEDYSFRKDELVNLWMCSGLIQPSMYEYQRLEDVGEYYLSILTRKSFFEMRSNESENLYKGIRNAGEFCDECYVMHDLLHELARTVSKKECIYISSNNFGNILVTVRHLNICMVDCSWMINFSQLKKLRTLIISFGRTVDERDQWNILREALKVATKLRVLRLYMESPLSKGTKLALDNLMHLRNLSFRSSYWKAPYLPCVYKLYHLQIIESHSCLWDSCRLSNLVNLRHLYFSGSQNGRPQIGGLTCLQGLHVSLKYVNISELKQLKDLRYLYINNIQANNVEEAKQAKLAEKGNLTELSLSWCHRQSESGTEEKYLDNLQPHMNLSKLKIDR
ncbi:unnamed protein product [Urochloa humidicola]